MNNKAVSVSLFGKKIHYFLKCLWNIQSFKKHNLFNKYDYILNTDTESLNLLMQIAQNEDIIIPENVKIFTCYNKNFYFNGSMWRFHPIYKCNYDIIYVADIDDFITDLYLYLYEDFSNSAFKFGMWKVGTADTKSLGDAGRCFFNCKLMGNELILKYKTILKEIDDTVHNFSYCYDNVFVNNILKNEFKTNTKYYISNTNESTFTYIQSQCNNIVDIRELDKKLPKNVTVDRKNFLNSFKYYDQSNNTYIINNNVFIVDRNYDGLQCKDVKLACNAYNQILNIIKNNLK